MDFYLKARLAEWADRVRGLENGEFWTFTALLVVVTLLAFYGIFRFYFRARLIEDIPTSRIRSAPQGYVELEGVGELMPGTPIVSPLSGTRCLWYSYRIEERQESYDSRGHRRSHWRTIASEVSDNLFLLKDDTGSCVIDPEGAEVTPSRRDVWYGNSPSWNHGLPSSQSAWNRLFTSGRYRYSEQRVDLNEHLYTLGRFHSVGGSQELPNTHEEVRALLAQWKRDPAFLRQNFDHNGDGEIDIHEWESARNAARKQVLKEQAERFRAPAVNILARPRHDRRPFILSVTPQTALVQRFKWLSGGSLVTFLLLGSLATWLITVRLVSPT